MALIEEGRVCVKKFGRDAGSRAVVTKVVNATTVSIMTAVRPRERKCNIRHLEFLSEKVDPKSREQLYRALEIEEPKAKPQQAAAAPAAKKKK